jgi:hypothetical protein
MPKLNGAEVAGPTSAEANRIASIEEHGLTVAAAEAG